MANDSLWRYEPNVTLLKFISGFIKGLVFQLHIVNKAERNASVPGDSALAVLGVFIEVCCLLFTNVWRNYDCIFQMSALIVISHRHLMTLGNQRAGIP